MLRLLDHPFIARLQALLFVGTVLVPGMALLVTGLVMVVIGVATAVAWQLLVVPTIALFLILWGIFSAGWRVRRSRLQLTVAGCVFEELPDGSTVLQLYVTVLNRGVPTTLTGWELVGQFGDVRRVAVHIRDRQPLPGRPVRPSLVAATSTTPLPTGEDDGLVWFVFSGTTTSGLEATRMTLRTHDDKGKIAETPIDIHGLAAQGRNTIQHRAHVSGHIDSISAR